MRVNTNINKWREYNLTINARMTFAKALLLSQYTNKATVICQKLIPALNGHQ